MEPYKDRDYLHRQTCTMRTRTVVIGGTFVAAALALTTCQDDPAPPQSPARLLSDSTYTISHDVLLRSEAYASDSNILGNVVAGSCVQAFADSNESREYLEVRTIEGNIPQDGWVHKRYLIPNQTAPTPCTGTLSPYTPPAQ